MKKVSNYLLSLGWRERFILLFGIFSVGLIGLRPEWQWPTHGGCIVQIACRRSWIWASPHVTAELNYDGIYLSLLTTLAFMGFLLFFFGEARTSRQATHGWRRQWIHTPQTASLELLRASQEKSIPQETLLRSVRVQPETDTQHLLRVPK